MDFLFNDAMPWVVAHKWWLAALTPVVIVVIVVKLLNPN